MNDIRQRLDKVNRMVSFEVFHLMSQKGERVDVDRELLSDRLISICQELSIIEEILFPESFDDFMRRVRISYNA